MSYDEHLISMAGGDGDDATDQLAAIEARSDYAMTHKSLAASDYAEMAWASARDVPALLALVRQQQDQLDRVLELSYWAGKRGWQIAPATLRNTINEASK